MALVNSDRVKETSTTSGTGAYSLAGAVTGFRTFVSGVGNGNTCHYCATDGLDWEVGVGTVTDASPDTLTRTAILASSNSGAAVNWSANSKTIFCTLPASVSQIQAWLGLVIGTNVQAYDAELAAIAGLTSAADKLSYFTGLGTAALADFTAAGRALVGGANYAAQRTTLSVRETLAANRTYYVRTDGSDSNDGLTDSAGGAFLTVQKGVNVASGLDLGGYDCTIRCNAATRTESVILKSTFGHGRIIIRGDTTTPSNCVFSVTAGWCFGTTSASATTNHYATGIYLIEGFKLQTSTSGAAINIETPGLTVEFGSVDFGTCAGSHIFVSEGAHLVCVGNYTVSGNAASHLNVFLNGVIRVLSKTITFTGNPAFSTALLNSSQSGNIIATGCTWTGAATGSKVRMIANGVINTGATAITSLPGSINTPVVATGGRFQGWAEKDVQSPATGFSITIADGIFNQILTPSGTLANGTLTMPAYPYDGQELNIASSQIITSLTHNPNSGQTLNGALTTMADNTSYSWVYHHATTTWLRMQ